MCRGPGQADCLGVAARTMSVLCHDKYLLIPYPCGGRFKASANTSGQAS